MNVCNQDAKDSKARGGVGFYKCATVTGTMALTVLAALEITFTDIGS
jgi:hypothetical protein